MFQLFPQPRVSELINGKISRMTADPLAKYLYRLGREVAMTTKTSRKRAAAIVLRSERVDQHLASDRWYRPWNAVNAFRN